MPFSSALDLLISAYMIQAVPHLSLNGSRLIRLLSEWTVADNKYSFEGFGARFGQLFALKDSLKLAEMHGELKSVDFDHRDIDKQDIQEHFLSARKEIVAAISSRFVAQSEQTRARVQFPSLRDNATKEQLSVFEVYQGFYINLQRQIDRDVQHLQSYMRDVAAGYSLRLAQLVEMDTTLAKSLANKSREMFALIPQLLARRFEYLLQNHHQALFNSDHDDIAQWTAVDGWLDRFRLDTYELLLAELDVRLQPVIGLLEAINEE